MAVLHRFYCTVLSENTNQWLLINLSNCPVCFVVLTSQNNFIIGPRREKTCLQGFANHTGADQPAHPRSLISAFVIRLLESIISRLATSEISMSWLISVAEETGLNLALSETPKTGFVKLRPNYYVAPISIYFRCKYTR